jgi:hypothetical protein
MLNEELKEITGYMPLEVELKDPDDFLLVKETLTRIGIASKQGNTLFQSCHILHKRGQYFIMNFKELFALDGKCDNIDESDIFRRNTIAQLLADWGLVVLKTKISDNEKAPMSGIKVISFKEKNEWELRSKYTVGNKKRY